MLLDVRRPVSVTMPRRIFALLPLCVFVVQEHMEYLIGHGSQPWTVGFHWSFVAGLLIQLPLVLGGYALARLLIRVAAKVFGGASLFSERNPATWSCRTSSRPVRCAGALASGDARFNRGPPLVVA